MAGRRFMDPTGHYNRPDIFRLLVDTTNRQATTAAEDLIAQDVKDAHGPP